MKSIVTIGNGQEKELLITAPWAMIEADYESLVSKYSKLPVKGFRPGKSPAGLVESFFARQIKDDLMASVSTRLCRKALKDTGLVAGSSVEISEALLQKGEELQFKAAFIEMPPFELPDYAALDLQAEDKEGKLDEISRKLLERTDISLHPRFVEDELRYSDVGGDAENERSNAENRVKLMLILKKIAQQDQIEIDEKDIDERVGLVAEENEVTPEYLRKFLIENQGMSRFTDTLHAEAVFDYIIEIQN